MRDSLDRIERFPEMYAAGRRGARLGPVDGFPYLVETVAGLTAVDVIAVTHASRNRPHA